MPENHQYRHGLAVMRAQPLHIGHEKVIRDMLAKCGKVTIILGSIQEQGTARNPFSYTERKQMIKNVFDAETESKRLRVIGLFDINNPTEWGKFVLDFLKEAFPDLENRTFILPAALMMRNGLKIFLHILKLLTAPITVFRTFPVPWCGT